MVLRFRLSERLAHGLRWALLSGWLLLIVSLLLPHDELLLPYQARLAPCLSGLSCELHDYDGNRLFWGAVVPISLLIIVALSHEAWRRLCPLAFVSQIFRALGWQRTVIGRGGRREVAKISQNSWLGRYHFHLQWMFLVAGLILRLLVLNSHPLALAVLLSSTLLAALVVGWAYSGKAWCQYFCPMGPVQVILTGPRSALGSSAHLQVNTQITQSMCRSVNQRGDEQSVCVACQTPCIDIDAERAYWQTLRGKRGLSLAWYSYPGLVLAFFLLLQWQGGGDVNYLRSGRWAYDATLTKRLWTPLVQWQRAVSVPIVPAGDVLRPMSEAPTLHQAPMKDIAPWSRLSGKLCRSWRPLGQGPSGVSKPDTILIKFRDQEVPVANLMSPAVHPCPMALSGGSRKPGSAF